MDKPVSLRKGTRASVTVAPQLAADGATVGVVIIKQMFSIDGRQRVVPGSGAEIRMIDEPWEKDDPEKSSTKLPSDLCLRKPSTDVIVVGSAMAPGGKPARTLDVFIRVGPIEKALRVHGMRVFYNGAKGLTLTPPEPFTAVPLRWELAFGGSDFSDPKRPIEEARNPVGRGVVRDPRALLNKPGPQIEDPRDPTTPAGLAALGRHWEPRRRYVGTYDEKWKRDRMPLPPLDFDDRFNQAAPADQITPAYLRGGELVQLHNLSSQGSMQFELPRLTFFVGARVDNALQEHRPVMDTVVLLPNERSFEMTWRSVIPLPKRRSRLEYVQVHEKEMV